MASAARLPLPCLGLLLVLHGCGGDAAGPEPEPDTTGAVRVTTTTTGESIDPDGYTVRLGTRSTAIDATGMVVFEGIEAGGHEIELTGVADNCTVAGGGTAAVVVTAGTTADVAFDVECGLFTEIACPAFRLETSTGLALDEVPMGTLPATLELPVAASISVDGTAHAGFAIVRTDEEAGTGEARLVVPLHPATPLDGGVVSLVVSDGTRACPPVEFTIEPLPAAHGELEAVVDLLQDIVSRQAAGLGTTVEELVSTPIDDLPPGLWPLAMAQTILDDPSNEWSLRAVAEGSQGAEAVEWLDRILARTEVRTTLEDAVPPEGGAASAASAARVTASECQPGPVSGDARLLHECMAAAAEARRAASGVSKKVAEDIKLALSAASSFAGEYRIPLVEAVEATFTFAFWLIYTEREKTAALYPSLFTDMTVKVDRDRFAEDEDAEGRVTTAEVTATNEGYDLQEALFDAFKEALSFAETTAKFDFSTGNQAFDEAISRVKPLIEKELREKEIEDLKIDPETFGPVDVNDSRWIQARVAAGEAIAMTGPLTWEPVLWGPATLSVRTFDGKFGGQQIARQVEVSVPAIQMTLTPKDTTVKASDPDDPAFVTFELRVLESVSPDSVDLDLSEHPRQGLAEIRVKPGSSVHEVDYLPPAEPDYDEPDLIVVRHTARAGARANGPPRTVTATIRFASITITGGQPCVEAGESTEPFEAEVRGLDDESVVWTASAGDIDANGVFTAPSEPPPGREVTITATSASDPDVSDEVTIRIGLCDLCRSEVDLSGEFGGYARGPANFVVEDGALEIGFDAAFVDGTEGDRISGGVVTAPWTGEAGTYGVTEASMTNHTNGGFAWFRPDEEGLTCASCGGVLTIEEAAGDLVVGTFEVTMPTLSPPPPQGEDPRPTTATGSFAAWRHVPGDPFDPYSSCVAGWEGR